MSSTLNLFPLVKKTTDKKYEIVIPTSVEMKIRALCMSNVNREWSGILFTTHEGSFEEDLTIIAQDICPMDVGSAAYTEFDMDPRVAQYMVENDLLDCDINLCHSHDTMARF